MCMTLKIDAEFESVIPKMTQEEYRQLEENILADGILMPLIVWNGTIVDGHNRYRIAVKHPGIDFKTLEKPFSDRYACLAWICSNQLGRRNLTPENKKYIIGRRYDIEKMGHGGNRRGNDEFSSGIKYHLKNNTRQKIARETGTSESYVKIAHEYAKGVDAAEKIKPGMKDKLLSGEIKANDEDVAAIAKAPEEARAGMVDNLCRAKDRTKSKKEKPEFDFSNGYYDDKSVLPNSTDEEATIVTEREILGSLDAAVRTLIRTCNNYIAQFPNLIEKEEYRKVVAQTLRSIEPYIDSIERNDFNFGKQNEE